MTGSLKQEKLHHIFPQSLPMPKAHASDFSPSKSKPQRLRCPLRRVPGLTCAQLSPNRLDRSEQKATEYYGVEFPEDISRYH